MLIIRMDVKEENGDPYEVAYATLTKVKEDNGLADYEVKLFNGDRLWKQGTIVGFAKKKRLGWDLLCKSLCNIIGDRNDIKSCES